MEENSPTGVSGWANEGEQRRQELIAALAKCHLGTLDQPSNASPWRRTGRRVPKYKQYWGDDGGKVTKSMADGTRPELNLVTHRAVTLVYLHTKQRESQRVRILTDLNLLPAIIFPDGKRNYHRAYAFWMSIADSDGPPEETREATHPVIELAKTFENS